MTEAIITVENLGKKYRIRHQADRQRYTALRDVITENAKGLFQKLRFGKQKEEEEKREQKAESRNRTPMAQINFNFLLSQFLLLN